VLPHIDLPGVAVDEQPELPHAARRFDGLVQGPRLFDVLFHARIINKKRQNPTTAPFFYLFLFFCFFMLQCIIASQGDGRTRKENMMGKTLQKLLDTRAWISHIDDERQLGNNIIVTLDSAYVFMDERNCGVRGYDTIAEVVADTRFKNIINKKCVPA
jgi:hypothetical protein